MKRAGVVIVIRTQVLKSGESMLMVVSYVHSCVVSCSSNRVVSYIVAVIDDINTTDTHVLVGLLGMFPYMAVLKSWYTQEFSLIMWKWANHNNYLQNVNVDRT